MPRSIDRRSFQFHNMQLYELMSQQAVFARNARRAKRRLVVIWLLNRLLILLAIAVSAFNAYSAAKFAKHMFGNAAGVLAALLVAATVLLIARALKSSAFVGFFRARERAARQKLARRRASLRGITAQLKAKSPTEASAS